MVKALLLAGGLGTRLREETEFKPKPMVEVGGKPIIWHIMKNLSQQGITDFVIAAGHKGEVIKDYFLNYSSRNSDFRINLGTNQVQYFEDMHDESNWNVTVIDTGELTMTGGRVFRSLPFLKGETFLCTYGDGLADIDIHSLIKFHKSHGKLATVSTVQPLSRFGVMDVDQNGLVTQFKEKPQLDGWVNAGFFVFEPQIVDYVDGDCILEEKPLTTLAAQGNLAAYRHPGFWQPMDTIREATLLNQLWASANAPWRNWA